MPSLSAVLRSSVGKKLINGFTGLLLCGFIVAHLAGNLLLLAGPEAFNDYVHTLETLLHGAAVPIAEAGLIVVFLAHAIAGIQVSLAKRRARPSRYECVGNAGGVSRKSLASRSMIVTGIVLAIFVPLHVWMFKLGPGIDAGYATTVNGEPFRDLYRLVVEWFQSPLVVAAYVGVMLLLGTHLRHGFWSAFQSLGANNAKYMPFLYAAGITFAVVMALGFLILPIYIYLFVDPAVGGHTMTG